MSSEQHKIPLSNTHHTKFASVMFDTRSICNALVVQMCHLTNNVNGRLLLFVYRLAIAENMRKHL